MADAPQPSNSSRISAMLQDLASQRASGAAPAGTPPPSAPVAVKTPPANLPIQQSTPPATSKPASPPVAIPVPRPVAPAPAATPPQAPAITPIPRPSIPPPAPKEAPIVPPPSIPRHPVAPAPAPKPVTPAPTPVAPPVAPTPVVPAQKQPISTELRTMNADIGSIRVGQTPTGIKPPVTVPAPATQAAPASPIVIPASNSSGSDTFKKVGLGILGLLVIGGVGFILMRMMGGNGEQVATPTPSESSTPSATLAGKSLRNFFGVPTITLNLESSATAKSDLKNSLDTAILPAKQAKGFALTSGSSSLSAQRFLELTVDAPPAALTKTLGSDWAALAFGQTEFFDASGAALAEDDIKSRFIFISEVSDASGANQAMQTWESQSMESACSSLFQYDPTKRIVSQFNSGTYRQISVRYLNFPYADMSIDYAIVSASNNKNYLIIAGSRQALFFAIDQLMQ